MKKFLLLALLLGCTDAKAKMEFPNVVKVGKTLDAKVIPAQSWGGMTVTEIRTEHAIIVVLYAQSIMLGRESFVKISADGNKKQFCIALESVESVSLEQCFWQ